MAKTSKNPADAVAADVDRIARAVKQAREAGAVAAVPARLLKACQRIVALGDADNAAASGSNQVGRRSPARTTSGRSLGETGAGHTAQPQTGDAGQMAQNVPLRRMIWLVIEPGEEFNVATVVERLQWRGAAWPANKVSNALGYWVERGRLHRVRHGVYQVPATLPAPDFEDRASARRDQRADASSRGVDAPRGKESYRDGPSESHERRAM